MSASIVRKAPPRKPGSADAPVYRVIIRCNPTTAQFIVDPAFEPVICTGPFAKTGLDAAYVAEMEDRVSRAWRRLQDVPSLRIPIAEYPLPEVRQAHSS